MARERELHDAPITATTPSFSAFLAACRLWMGVLGITGDRLAEELLAIRPDIPIIICTGFSERLNQGKTANIGAKSFLMKPIVKEEMAGMVRKVLDGAKDKGNQ